LLFSQCKAANFVFYSNLTMPEPQAINLPQPELVVQNDPPGPIALDELASLADGRSKTRRRKFAQDPDVAT
jgi:hypothetical protein